MTDSADQAEELFEFSQALAFRNHRQNRDSERPDLDDAGRRLCLDCGDPIPEERIILLPWCVRCVDCQELHEQKDR